MKELDEKLDQLKKEISKTEIVLELQEKKEQILKDKELVEKIEKYHKVPSDELKDEIVASSSFLAYKESETKLNLMILDINQKLKQIKGENNCRKEEVDENN